MPIFSFDKATGRPVATLGSAYPAPEADIASQAIEGRGVVDMPPPSLDFWYFPNGVPTIRPRLDIRQTNVDRRYRFKGIPQGAVVSVTGPYILEPFEADGTIVELSFAEPGAYTLSFTLWPYLPVAMVFQVS